LPRLATAEDEDDMRKIIPFPIRQRTRMDEPTAPAGEPAAPPPTPAGDPASVTFTRPFQLEGMDAPHPAGTFELRTTRDDLDVMWPAYRTTTRIMLPNGPALEAHEVTAAELEAALARDRAPGA
jgi:hypothetical protein